MRILREGYTELDTLRVLQLRTTNDPWLSGLKTFECEDVTEEFVPFIPLFLSSKTIEIDIDFDEDTPAVVVASAITSFPKLCPDLESISLSNLPRDSVITEAVSEMLLTCNRDTLKMFRVLSPLTEAAREVVFRLPRLSQLRTVILGSISLPTVALPNLNAIDVEYDDDFGWLRGFRGGRLERLEAVTFRFRDKIKPEEIGDPLGTFQSVALAASAQNALSEIAFYTRQSWNPNYSALLSFHQLKKVEIQSSCVRDCSSRVDDDIITSLAQAMPKLETLRLGASPCGAPVGATVKGLISLARLCPHLSNLRVHFQTIGFAEVGSHPASIQRSGGGGEGVVVRRV